jgi:hypothetical protein
MRRTEARDGAWRLLDCQAAWEGNPTWDRFIAFSWDTPDRRLLVAVNYGPTRGQCSVQLPWAPIGGRPLVLEDLMDPTIRHAREDLARRGLDLDLPPWGHHVFAVGA